MAKHTSIIMNQPCELIDVVPMNPFVSHCKIKVCYVGNTPNRNGSVITKAMAKELANTLPGSPIVGFYNEQTGDFEEHNRRIEIAGGELRIEDTTRPYGFVDMNAKAWFQDYLDDGVPHTYLVTEGWIWTGVYPESSRVVEKGNNQSMELDPDTLDGFWASDDKNNTEFFIINGAIIKKLCILGEDFEPCFEGAGISNFSLNDDFNLKIYNLMKEVRELKGGNCFVETENLENVVEPEVVDEPIVEPVTEFAATEEEPVVEEPAAVEEEPVTEFAAEEEPLDVIDNDIIDNEENNEEMDNEVQFSLDDFHNLQQEYSDLETRYNELQSQYDTMQSEYAVLVEFKKGKDREDKQAMIDSFSMLSDEDKADVVSHIDEYSVDEIEAKLAVICVRNKLNMSESTENAQGGTTFSLDDIDDNSEQDNAPAWLSLLRKAKNNEN